MQLLDSFRSVVAGARDQAAATQAEVDRLKSRRKQLNALLLPKADFIAACCESIDREASLWRAEALPLMLKNFIAQPDSRFRLPLLEANGAYSEQGKVYPGPMYALFAPELKKALSNHIEKMDWPTEVGPSRAARRAELTRIDSELNELEAGLKQLRREATANGVDLDTALFVSKPA